MNVTLQPEILQWARRRAGLSEKDLAKKLNVKDKRVESWEENGELTYKQAENLAKKTHTAFGYLFLTTPPEESLPVADFRTRNGADAGQPSLELLDTIYEAMSKQDWYRDHLITQDADPLDFISRATIKDDPQELAKKVCSDFNFSTPLRSVSKNWEEALGYMFDHCEEQGVIILRSGVAKGNTHRPLSIDEFRGFALSDPYAPVIFINSKDSPAAQMFTLVHELIHLYLGLSGVSNLEGTYASEKRVEQFCNQTAAEVLVPTAEIQNFGKKLDLAGLRRHFKVSTLVLLRRLQDVGIIDQETFWQLYKEEEELFKQKQLKQQEGSGGNYFATQKVRVGKSFARALITSTLEGSTLYRDAYSLLGVKKVSTFKKLAREFDFKV